MLSCFEHNTILQAAMPGTFPGLDYTLDHYHQRHPVKHQFAETSSDINGNQVVDYMQPISSGFCSSTSQPSFAEVRHIAEFRPKSAPNQTKTSDEETGIDPVYFLKFPVLNEKSQDRFLGDHNGVKSPVTEAKTKRKRSRSRKTSEEVESQRMTHIAVERNRRRQMNEHLRVIRSLMPGPYVQRGDQASIVGEAIEFVRELEQLLQCLESQKRRRLYGDDPTPIQDSLMAIVMPRTQNLRPASTIGIVDMTATQQPQPPFLPSMPLPNDDNQMKLVDYENGVVLQEETAESKSFLADVEVKLLGFDAMIKILSRRRPGQLIQIIAALEDMQLHIFHTNVTTIEQTVLYSFNVKVAGQARSVMAEDIANSVQQIFSFIDATAVCDVN